MPFCRFWTSLQCIYFVSQNIVVKFEVIQCEEYDDIKWNGMHSFVCDAYWSYVNEWQKMNSMKISIGQTVLAEV